jgi:general secretion pathway protein G
MKKKLSRSRARRNGGFTLIEVLLVLAILLVVAGAVVVNAVGVSDDANKKFAKSQISNLTNSVNLYRLNTGSYPSTLDALYSQPADIADPSKWTRVIDKPVPADPWNRPYDYKTTGTSFEIRCLGPDGQANTQDDITG